MLFSRKRIRFSLFAFLIFVVSANGQLLKGQITDEQNTILSGAWVAWPGIDQKVIVNSKGEFQVFRPDSVQIFLVAGCKGFESDTFLVGKESMVFIELTKPAKTLDQVQILKRRQGSFISESTNEKTEVITQKELTKAACCDMAGCFETQATVQPQTTNVVTNAKELRILGLSGVYNQVLIDGLPMIQGLSYTYGISSYPSAIIDKIYVAKGANSVLQGFEGVSGQINVMTRNPEKEPRLYTNAYINNFGEWHLNANYSMLLGKEKKWSTLLGVHAVQPANRRDRDKDGFLDLPLLTRYSVFNRWNYGKENEKGIYTQFSFRFTDEQRIGGQRDFNARSDKGSTRSYGQTVNYSQPELIGKLGYRFSASHSIQCQLSGLFHNQVSYFGTLRYEGKQQSVNAILQHQWNWNDKNTLTWGGSFRFQNLKENIRFTDTIPVRNYAGQYQTNLQVPGVFAEHTSNLWKEKISWIVGARMDWHQTYGSYFTPRTLIKYEFTPGHILRISSGISWRQVNVFSENINLMASSRDVVFEEKLKPEQALNWGINYTYKFEKEKLVGTVSTDFYQTSFQNQFFPDYFRNPGKAYIRNFTGTSISNAFQIETNVKAMEVFELKLAYNYVEVYRKENGKKTILPFNPQNRVMTSLSYRPKNDRWYFDGNIHWYDRQRLPDTEINSEGEAGPEFSKPYSIFSSQITHKIRQFEIYIGVENIFDFRQLKPIVGWQNPSGPNFDTSTVWGPTRGREFYLGFRWKLEREKAS